jgi:DNA-binding NarL/FixJ family response regulator
MYSVIIVDDHPMICSIIRILLQDTGRFEVVAERTTGSAGLAAVRDLAPNLLIVDLDVPLLGGIEVIRRVRASQANVSILVVSSAEEGANGVRVMSAGANGFVSKGCDLGDVVTAASMLVQGKSFFSQDVMAHAANFPQLMQHNPVSMLSEKEFEVFRCLAQGQSNLEIAAHMLISNKTASAYRRRIMEKLGLSNIRDLIELAKAHDMS